MKTWIALLRGVNVGGKNKLSMKELIVELQKIGFTQIKSYIQSGNIIFYSPRKESSELATDIKKVIKTKFGFEPQVIVFEKTEFIKAVTSNPFQKAQNEMEGRTLHLLFLSKIPEEIDQSKFDVVKRSSEHWQVIGMVFYLYAPEGFHQSKIAAKLEKILNVSATARNWRTVSQILEIINAM